MGGWSAHKSGETEATGGVTRGDGAGLFRVLQGLVRYGLSSGRPIASTRYLSCYLSTKDITFSLCVGYRPEFLGKDNREAAG